jgi:hypothetical protein
MTDSTVVRLVCIRIEDNLKVHDAPFTIRVPPSEDIGGVIHFVKEVTPSLKDIDHGKFRFYKPPSDHPVSVCKVFHGFQLTRENLGSPLPVPCKVDEVFLEKDAGRRFDIDIVVHINSGEWGMFFYLSIKRAFSLAQMMP